MGAKFEVNAKRTVASFGFAVGLGILGVLGSGTALADGGTGYNDPDGTLGEFVPAIDGTVDDDGTQDNFDDDGIQDSYLLVSPMASPQTKVP